MTNLEITDSIVQHRTKHVANDLYSAVDYEQGCSQGWVFGLAHLLEGSFCGGFRLGRLECHA